MDQPNHQYRWDGTDDISSIFGYSHSLGPRSNLVFSSSDSTESKDSPSALHILPLTLEEVEHLISLQLHTIPSLSWTNDDIFLDQNDLQTFRLDLITKIDSFLSSIPSNNCKWFLKTNRHSCKDSPLDFPTEKDLSLFAQELDRFPIPTEHVTTIDEVDFGSSFLAMCRSRLESTAVQSGEDVLSLLTRSKRIYGDFSLQVRLRPTPWDCYLAFSPYDDQMAQYPFHEFRCYISNRQIRCIMQYSYLVTCPISADDMPFAIEAIIDFLQNKFLPMLSSQILDLAVDVQCLPVLPQQYEIKFIETNPLGPGTVWGHLSWDTDRCWLLFDPQDEQNPTILPPQTQISDTQGGERRILWQRPPNQRCVCVVLYTTCHPRGMVWGALAHIPPDYMLIIWKKWRLEELQEGKSRVDGKDAETDENKRAFGCAIT